VIQDASCARSPVSRSRPADLYIAGDSFYSWPHTGRQPRVMAQPGVALHDQFPLTPPLSPVELAMASDI